MKIRIKGNSIRYRLTRSEVDRFGKEGMVNESTDFGSGKLQYVLKTANQPAMSAVLSNQTITLLVPQTWAEEWVSTERVGYEAHMPLPSGDSLYLLLEKDFVCLDNTTEDQSDNYPNPLADMHK